VIATNFSWQNEENLAGTLLKYNLESQIDEV
jgi:hypothetical protein